MRNTPQAELSSILETITRKLLRDRLITSHDVTKIEPTLLRVGGKDFFAKEEDDWKFFMWHLQLLIQKHKRVSRQTPPSHNKPLTLDRDKLQRLASHSNP